MVSDYQPAGDQPAAIAELTRRLEEGRPDVVLLGATGTGKSATTAWLVEQVQRPTLVMAPNKTLAAQLANEFRELLPHNAVEYFVSYYDYYQPEAYVPQTDTYIEKDSSVNEEVERLRHSATMSLLTRRDVIVVASVSCIYGLGTPQEYVDRMVRLRVGDTVERDQLLRRFVDVQYTRNDLAFTRGTFRVRGDTVEVFPVYEELAVRVEMFGDEIERVMTLHPLTGEVVEEHEEVFVFPATHYVAGPRADGAGGRAASSSSSRSQLAHDGGAGQAARGAAAAHAHDLRRRDDAPGRLLQRHRELLPAHRRARARHGPAHPARLLPRGLPARHRRVARDGAADRGDVRGRPQPQADPGRPRLPAAQRDGQPAADLGGVPASGSGQTVHLSATPGPYELSRVQDDTVEQVIRPTGLVDPEIVVKPTKGQIDDLVHEIRVRAERDERVLVTTLTKKMSEDLTDYLLELGVRVRYLHSEVDTIRRIELLKELRRGEYDVLVGINLLREGLDLPEVSLVSILDADKEGFLRSGTSLIQTIGRAARNVSGQVHMYADKVTPSMAKAIDETNRRREKQVAYNLERGRRPAAAAQAGRRHPRRPGARGRRRRAGRRRGPAAVARQGAGAWDVQPQRQLPARTPRSWPGCPARSWRSSSSSCRTRCTRRRETCPSSWRPGCATR